jgi:hypothetical protein
MTVTAVVTQYFQKYCESSNSPVFAHIWVCTPLFHEHLVLILLDPDY